MKLRTATAADAGAIAEVLVAAFKEFESAYTPAAYAATILTREIIAERIERGEMLVALADGTIVGTVTMEPHDEHVLVRSMAVAPPARGRGVARALLDEVERRAVQANRTQLTLATTPFLSAATRLYESLGFRRIAGVPRDLHGTPLILMAKGL